MNFESYIEKGIKENLGFKEALDIVKANSLKGRIFAAGGFVYRTIVQGLYGVKSDEIFDFDFIVENPVDSDMIKLPHDWDLRTTHHGDSRFINGIKQIDLFPINHAVLPSDYDRTHEMSLDEKLNSYFRRACLNMQSIAYDLNERRVLGEIGKKSILERKIEVNNIQESIDFCKARRMSIHKFIRDKAKTLQFKAIFPDFNEGFKVETKMFYDKVLDRYWKDRTESYEQFITNYLSEEFNFFVENLLGKRVMDLGSGPGRDSLLFKQKGLQPVCVDISSSMIKICRENGLEAYEKDIENLDFEDGSFDGIWAYASLLHLPKNRIYNAVARVKELLKPNGLFLIGMVEGDKEIFYKNNKTNHQRFFLCIKITN